MPKFNDTDTALVKHNTGQFGFSAVRIEDLLAPEYTLVTIAVDRSGSTSKFQRDMENTLKEVVKACQRSPRADNLMIRLVAFDDSTSELIGWEMLNKISLDRFDNILTPGGMTALYDGSINGIEGMSLFGRQLLEQDYSVNGIFICLTDGMENRSKMKYNDPVNPGRDTAKYVRQALENAISGENLESLVSILIAVNAGDAAQELDQFKNEVGFTQFVDINLANAKVIEKFAKFVSDSISSQSQALGTGGPSKALPPPI